jgi:DNA-binding XRE family transcriptional regulator
MSLQRCTFRGSKGKGRHDQNFNHERGRSPLEFGIKVLSVGMNEDAMKMTARQVRAARALLDLSQQRLANRATVLLNALVRFEEEIEDPALRTLDAVYRTLTKAGIEFLFPNEKGEGVRLKSPRF